MNRQRGVRDLRVHAHHRRARLQPIIIQAREHLLPTDLGRRRVLALLEDRRGLETLAEALDLGELGWRDLEGHVIGHDVGALVEHIERERVGLQRSDQLVDITHLRVEAIDLDDALAILGAQVEVQAQLADLDVAHPRQHEVHQRRGVIARF